MQQVVEQVLGAEVEARERIERAKKQSAAIRGSADEQASALLAQARSETAAAAKRRLEEARGAASELLDAARAEEEAASATVATAARAHTDTIVADIVAMIAGRPDLGP